MQKGIQEGIQKGTQEGMLSEAHDVLVELLEEQFGPLPPGLTEKIRLIQSHSALRMLRRQRGNCPTLEDFERLLEATD